MQNIFIFNYAIINNHIINNRNMLGDKNIVNVKWRSHKIFCEGIAILERISQCRKHDCRHNK